MHHHIAIMMHNWPGGYLRTVMHYLRSTTIVSSNRLGSRLWLGHSIVIYRGHTDSQAHQSAGAEATVLISVGDASLI